MKKYDVVTIHFENSLIRWEEECYAKDVRIRVEGYRRWNWGDIVKWYVTKNQSIQADAYQKVGEHLRGQKPANHEEGGKVAYDY